MDGGLFQACEVSRSSCLSSMTNLIDFIGYFLSQLNWFSADDLGIWRTKCTAKRLHEGKQRVYDFYWSFVWSISETMSRDRLPDLRISEETQKCWNDAFKICHHVVLMFTGQSGLRQFFNLNVESYLVRSKSICMSRGSHATHSFAIPGMMECTRWK